MTTQVTQITARVAQAAPNGSTLSLYAEGSTVVLDSAVVTDDAVEFTVTAGLRYDVGKTTPNVHTLTVDATSGGYDLTVGAEDPIACTFDDDAEDDIQAAIEALDSIGTGNVLVEGGPGDEDGTTPYTITFVEALAGENVVVSVEDDDLAGGGTTVEVEVTTAGVKDAKLFKITTVAGNSGSSHPVTKRSSGVYNPGV